MAEPAWSVAKNRTLFVEPCTHPFTLRPERFHHPSIAVPANFTDMRDVGRINGIFAQHSPHN
jgi:hypothetical protein